MDDGQSDEELVAGQILHHMWLITCTDCTLVICEKLYVLSCQVCIVQVIHVHYSAPVITIYTLSKRGMELLPGQQMSGFSMQC
jgi:hypothetical protein